MSQLPKGWVGTTLIELANFIDYRGRTPKKTDSGIPLITAKNIKDGFINREPREYIAEGDYYDWMTRGFPKVGDVLLTTEAPLGNVAQIDIEEKFALAQRAICFQFYETGIERFIYYYLRSPLFNQELDLNSTGSTVKGIKAATLKKLPVHIAPLPEQKRIVEILDEVLAQVDTIKARLDGIPDLLKRFRQSVLASAVSGKLTEEWRFDNAHSEWTKLSIGDISVVATGKTPKRTNSKYWDHQDVPWLTSSATGSLYCSEAEQFVSEFAVNDCKLKLFPIGTLLLAMYGEGKTRGQVTELMFEATCNQACAAIMVDHEIALTTYVKLRLLENYEETRKAASGGNQPNLNLNKVREIPIELPCLEEQKEIVRLVDQYFAFADTIEAQVKKAQARIDNLTQSILAKAFRGELVPQNDDDEPAEVLLERIAKARKEAEALAKAAKKAGNKKA